MSVLAIIRPLPATYGGNMTDAARMGTPDPREVAYSTGSGARTIDMDLGSVQSVGAIYLGGATFAGSFQITGGVAGYTETVIGDILSAPKRTAVSPRQYLATFPPINVRYIRLSANLNNGWEVGVAVAGERFSPTFGHEWGAGRYLADTGTATRNRAGGFGVDPGAVVAGWEFTLGDLTDEEREVLFDMLRKIGETRPVIVAEDPDVTPDLDARLHYGLFQRLEKYERVQTGVTRWALKVEEWGTR